MVELLKALAEGRDPEKANIDRYRDILGPIQEMWTMELAERIVLMEVDSSSG